MANYSEFKENDLSNDSVDSDRTDIQKLNDCIDKTNDIELLRQTKEELNNLDFYNNEKITDNDDSDSSKVLKRNLSAIDLENRQRDNEEVLDNYAKNLRDRDLSENEIENFKDEEREKMNTWDINLDKGEPSKDIYFEPTDFDAVAEDIKLKRSNDIEEDDPEQNEYTENEIETHMFKEFDKDGLIKE